YSERSAVEVWRSIKPGKGVGVGTLFKMARKGGWRDEAQPRQPRLIPAARRPVERAKAARHGMGAADVWQRCIPASTEHGYIAAKMGAPEGLRVLPDGDSLTIVGQPMAGALVVPVLRHDGTLSSLQLIPPPGAGKKLNLPGAPI